MERERGIRKQAVSKDGIAVITVNFADYMKAEPPGHEILRPSGSGDYLFLYFPKPMNFFQGKEWLATKKHACILLGPRDAHRFTGNPDFINTYIHFDASENEVEALGVETNQFFYPSDFERMNRTALDIKSELLTGGELHREMIHAAMLELLVLIRRSFSSMERDPQKEQFENLRYEMLSDCSRDISVPEMAARLCMSRTAFYESYRKYFHSSPKQDLLRVRMEKAAVLLTNQRKTVAAVAEETGFQSMEHFTRYYKKYYGKSPRG